MAALAGGAPSRSDERPVMSEVDIDLLIRGRSSRRRWLLLAASAVLVAVAVATWFLLRPGETDVVAEPQRSEAVMGQLSTTVNLSGSAEAERSTTLSFGVSGTLASVEVESGDAVQTGDVLATLDDADAQRRVATAETQLRLAELRLDALLADPTAVEIASARQSIESAETQVLNAEQALTRLSEPPAASDLASAEQAVASALGQLSSAEEALARLSEPPGASDLASAEQAVANALGQLSSAEEALAALIAGPGETEIAAARTDVTQARAQLSGAIDRADDSWHALADAFDEFCEQYDHLGDVAEGLCTVTLPLSDAQVRELRDLAEDRSSNFQRYANAVINANVAFVADDATRQSAVTALSSAEQRLADLLAPASEEDRYQAEQSVEAARASHTAAVARLEELQAEPSAEDVRQAELAVEAARASHTAAVARLEDLRAPVDEGEFEQARASLESARATLASARARYDELSTGPTANAIAQQEENVRLSEISLEEARAALADFTVTAPFHGIVEAVNVQPGDRVAASLAAFTLSTSDRILIALTVTEADLLSLEVGQTGIATFDAIDDVEYPVRIASSSRVPNAAQGVVTYEVEARLLAGPEIAEVAAELAALRGTGGDLARLLAGAGFGAAVGEGSGGSAREDGAAGGDARGAGGLGGGGLLAGLDLPEGVTIQDVLQAVANGEPLPEGVTLPEDFEIAPPVLEQGAETQQGALAARPLPAPGMSASVTILKELREEAVLVPVSAVRQLDGGWFVTVPAPVADDAGAGAIAFEHVTVEVGESDGTNVEILSGIEAGAVLLIGADNSGIAFSATQQQQQLRQQPGGGFGGGGPAGGGRQ
ncbi:MAG: biotin/lipoyl-binding protein [Chloroflexi bacterium]|nr:biotin/lipoyl-binding protein [Chloroflexota bacterium]